MYWLFMYTSKYILSIEWNSIRIGGPSDQKFTQNSARGWWGFRGWGWGGGPGLGVGVVGVQEVGDKGGGPGAWTISVQFSPWLWAWTRFPQFQPWVWAWRSLCHIPLNFPLAVDMDQIPLNFPPGCGPEDPSARSPSTSPLDVGLNQIPLNFPIGCGPGPDPIQFPP